MPRKNVRLVAGKPLIGYTIEAAQRSRYLTQVVVSTDDREIAETASRFGARVLMRPVELAEDDTPMVPVLQHALAEMERKAGVFDMLVLLQPTTPLRTAEHIDQGIEMVLAPGADSVVSVYEVGDTHPARMYREVEGFLVPYETEPAHRLRQKMPRVYHRNGAFYGCRRSLLVDGGVLLGPRPRPLFMSREDSINIDDEFDLLLAELLIRHRQATGVRN